MPFDAKDIFSLVTVLTLCLLFAAPALQRRKEERGVREIMKESEEDQEQKLIAVATND